MAVITRIPAPTISEIFRNYGIDGVIESEPISDGIENTNYLVRARNPSDPHSVPDEYVFTLIETENGTAEHLATMVKILDACAEYGLPVAPPIRTDWGAASVELHGRPVYVARRLPGKHENEPSDSQCAAIGRFLARMHLATSRVQAADYMRDVHWLESHAEEVDRTLSWTNQKLLELALAQVDSLLGRADVQSLPRGVIHGDLFRDNALFNEHGLSGVVDFHHAGTGYWIYDVAVTLNDWCSEGPRLCVESAMSMLRAYHSKRPFTTAEIHALPTFLQYAALAFWLSRLVVAAQADLPEDYPMKDPDEFRDILDHRTRLPFRVDPLLLT